MLLCPFALILIQRVLGLLQQDPVVPQSLLVLEDGPLQLVALVEQHLAVLRLGENHGERHELHHKQAGAGEHQGYRGEPRSRLFTKSKKMAAEGGPLSHFGPTQKQLWISTLST